VSSLILDFVSEVLHPSPVLLTSLPVCNGPDKCVFVRVVDTCAGCAAGSKHVDLTKAAFAQLADLNAGALTVQMRPSTDPSEWQVQYFLLRLVINIQFQ
jgi:expansin (peptidoglycan-binding protein)